MGSRGGAKRRFCLVLVKPSHYDENGYVLQWVRSPIPSNSLASLYGLAQDCAQRKILGDDVEIEIHALDETNTRIRPERLAKLIEDAGTGIVMLTGVQSNQFPRALDLGRKFRAAGIPVVMGGFHVSGCLSMLRELPPALQEALDLGITLFAGEGEGRMAGLLRDIDGGTLKPIYNYLSDMPDLDAATVPILPRQSVARVLGKYASFDAGRGCPFQCSFCTIINVQGRKSRFRTADDVEAIVRAQAKQKITRFFITDDNFARNRNWEAILDRLIELREKEGFKIRLLLQVDTLCHRIPTFIEKAARAGPLRLHRAREHQPAIADGDQEASEQDLGISRDAAGVAARRGDNLLWLHPRLPDRYSGIDRARHRDHQERAADRHFGVLLPDAAAGLGGP